MKSLHDEINSFSHSRLQWACRRGMLELDVLLGNFLNEAYSGLTNEQKNLFVQLLECTDPEIFSWLLAKAVPTDPGLITITDMVRQHARSRI